MLKLKYMKGRLYSSRYRLYSLLAFSSLLLLAASSFSPAKVLADFFVLAPYIVTASPENTSALANGEDEITMHIHVTGYKCAATNAWAISTSECNDGSEAIAYDAARPVWVRFNSQSAGESIDVSAEPFWTDGDGNGTVSLKSSTIQTASVQFFVAGADSNYASSDTITIRFDDPEETSPDPPASSSAPSSRTSGGSSKAAIGTTADAPKDISLSTIEYQGQSLSDFDKATFALGEDITLRGTTQPNAIVTLYIHSDPQTVSFPADAEGKWAYVITGLEPGEHSVEADFRASQDAAPSDRKLLAHFTIEAQANGPDGKLTTQSDKKAAAKKHTSLWPAVLVGTVVALVLMGVALYFVAPLRKRIQSLLARLRR